MSMPIINRELFETYKSGIDVVDNFIAREETQSIIERFESVNGGKDVLQVDRIIRGGGVRSINSVVWGIH